MLLDVFNFLIQADAKGLDSAVETSGKKIEDLNKGLKKSEQIASSMSERLVGYLKGVGVAALASYSASAVMANVAQYARGVDAMRSMSDATGIAIEDIDAFGKAVQAIGGDSQSAQMSLQMLSMRIGRDMEAAAHGGESTLGRMGIAMKDAGGQARGTMEIMGDLADKLQGMNKQQAIFALRRMGIMDAKTIELVMRGRGELDALMRAQKALGVETKESAERAKKYTEATGKLGLAIEAYKEELSGGLMPVFTRAADLFERAIRFLMRHKDFVTGFFAAVATVITVAYLPAITRAAIATWAVIGPFVLAALAITAAGVAIAALYDDIMNFLEGNDSLIGRLSKDWPWLGETVEWLAGVVGDAFAAIGDAGDKFVADQVKMFNDLIETIKTLIGWYDRIRGMASWLIERGAAAFGPTSIDRANQMMAQANFHPMNPVTAGAISNMSSVRTESNVSVGQVTVNTQATDATGVARDLGGALRRELNTVQTEAASGVAR